jgi:hypothetical protein
MSEMDVEAGIAVGLGITVDSDSDVVILVVVSNDEVRLGVPMLPHIARAFASAMVDMSFECEQLQGELGALTPDQIKEHIIRIQERFSAPSN